jgi:hypothetical protein
MPSALRQTTSSTARLAHAERLALGDYSRNAKLFLNVSLLAEAVGRGLYLVPVHRRRLRRESKRNAEDV